MSNYKITTLNAFEMFFSIFIIGSMFLPWMKMDMSFMGTSQTITKSMVDDTPPPIFYIICTLCIVNVIVKIFNRSLWLSFITAAFPLGYVIDMANNLHEIRIRMASETLSFGHVSLGAGAILSAALSAAILISVFCEWIFYMQEKASKSPREKYKRYFLLMGIGIIIAVITLLCMGFLPQLIAGEEISAATRGITSIMLVVIGVLGILMFIQYLLLALMTLAHHRKGNNTTQSEIVSASSKEEEVTDNQEEATITQEAIPENIQDSNTPEKSNRTILYAIGGIIAVAIIGIICFFAFGKSKQRESILGLQQPKWEKFVHMRGKETAFFKSPDTSSPRLMQASNDEGCDVVYQYLWSDEKPREGFTDLENYKYSDETSVFPVIEEYENWYKVHINDGEKLCEAYVEKAQCEEVKPEPITQEILTQISTDYHLQKEGKYANICFKLGSTESGGHLCMGELIDEKCLAFSPAYKIGIIESDTTQNTTFDRGSFTFDDGTKEYFFTLYYNPSRAITLNDYKTFDTKKITEAEIGKFISTMSEVKPKDMKISYEYYFPTVSTSNLFCFNIHNEVQETTNTESSSEKHVTEYKADDQNLMALVDGEWIETGITSMLRFEVYQQQDLDNDGNTEIILKNFDGGNDVYCPYVVYYDKATNSFKESKPMESEEEPTIETGESGTTFIVQTEGLRTIKYEFAEGTLKLVSDKMKDVGKIRRTLTIKDVYPDDGNGERNMTFDFDGDGEEENVTFYRGTTHAEGYGKYMEIKMIKWSDGRVAGSEDGSLIFADKFRFLASETNGMPDIIADSYLKKWNGSSYE